MRNATILLSIPAKSLERPEKTFVAVMPAGPSVK
jgi:hypothetical protein